MDKRIVNNSKDKYVVYRHSKMYMFGSRKKKPLDMPTLQYFLYHKNGTPNFHRVDYVLSNDSQEHGASFEVYVPLCDHKFRRTQDDCLMHCKSSRIRASEGGGESKFVVAEQMTIKTTDDASEISTLIAEAVYTDDSSQVATSPQNVAFYVTAATGVYEGASKMIIEFESKKGRHIRTIHIE